MIIKCILTLRLFGNTKPILNSFSNLDIKNEIYNMYMFHACMQLCWISFRSEVKKLITRLNEEKKF